MFFFWDWTFILLVPALILAIYAQSKVRSAYAQYSRVPSRSGMSGAQVARSLLDSSNLAQIKIERIPGRLSDHYDPRTRVMKLSEEVYNSKSVAALGVAAHETGHAIQHGTGYAPLMLRNSFVPVANFGSGLAFPLFILGFLFSGPLRVLMDVGILLFSVAVVFHIVTLPVELNASQKALALLNSEGILETDEVTGARKVLNAAAWTYVAAAAMAALQLLRLIFLRGRRD